MTHDALTNQVQQYLGAWASRDPEAIGAFHTPDAVAESPSYATLRGRQAIEEAARAFVTSFPDAAQTIEAVVVDAPYAACFSTVHATHSSDFFGLPGTGRRIEFRNAWLITFNDDGLIVHERRIYDFTGLLVQIGVLRAKPAKP
jgi:steroid delta-isomerase-like uncharacterized protein